MKSKSGAFLKFGAIALALIWHWLLVQIIKCFLNYNVRFSNFSVRDNDVMFLHPFHLTVGQFIQPCLWIKGEWEEPFHRSCSRFTVSYTVLKWGNIFTIYSESHHAIFYVCKIELPWENMFSLSLSVCTHMDEHIHTQVQTHIP